MDLNNRLLGTFKDFINDINEFDNEIGEKCKEHYKEIIELSELLSAIEGEIRLIYTNRSFVRLFDGGKSNSVF